MLSAVAPKAASVAFKRDIAEDYSAGEAERSRKAWLEAACAKPSQGPCDGPRLCLQASSFNRPSLATPFCFLDEVGHPPSVRAWSVERERKIRKQPVF